jgi:hypothetical protein
MAIITAPAATGGTPAVSDTYYYDLFQGTWNPTTNQVSWKYPNNGTWAIKTDKATFSPDDPFTDTSKPDTFIFRSTFPANTSYNEYDDPMTWTWPGVKPLWPEFQAFDVVKDSSGNYTGNYLIEFADFTRTGITVANPLGSGTNPRGVVIEGLGLDSEDVIRFEDYKSYR